MPPVKITRTQQNGAPTAEVTPEEVAAIRASIGGKEQAPSSRVQSVYTDWRKVADQLGDPFETEKIPISKLRQMRRDPMLGFGLSFTKTPHIGANWHINASSNKGPNAQIAAHADHDLRRIWGSFILQAANILDFGFQGLAKRFEYRVPSGTYIEISDSGERDEKPIWSEGGIQPVAFKPFIALRPEGVQPLWSSDGEFDGIEYTPTSDKSQSGSGSASTGGGAGGTNKEETFKIDLFHALWLTNEKESNFGSIFGYPRLGYAYRYWWSYWFRWAIADRAFERKADPSVLIYHPDGEFVDADTGARMSHSEYALLMGERMRSGGVIALPSEVYEDSNGRGTIRQWEIDFTKDAVNFEPFDKSFDYLDVQKLRSLFVPEQAFLEGKGGTSSRNVAATLGSSFVESQKVLNAQFVEAVNRWILPQWLAANYPEFVVDGGTVEVIVQGFGDEDVAFMDNLVQLIGQQEEGSREIAKLVDIQKMLEDRGTPIVSFAEQKRREEQQAAAAQAAAAPTVPLDAVPPGQTAPVATATGFSYVANMGEIIYLSESGKDFVENLPSTPHYEDKTIRAHARRLWTLYRDLYRDEYEEAALAIEDGEGAIVLSDDDVELADVKKLLERWNHSRWVQGVDKALDTFTKVMKRAAKLELGRAKLKGTAPQEELDNWLQDHMAAVAASAAGTTRTEVEKFVARQVQQGVTDRKEIAAKVREHFSSHPDWKADRLVRTEVRDIYNAATLLAAEAVGVDRVQALDARLSHDTDEECANRDGQIFSVDDAFKEDEHPNGTLAWRLVPVELSIQRSAELEHGAEFDEDTKVLTLAEDLDDETERVILISVVDALTR